MYLGEIELYVQIIYSQVEFEFFLVYKILFKLLNNEKNTNSILTSNNYRVERFKVMSES